LSELNNLFAALASDYFIVDLIMQAKIHPIATCLFIASCVLQRKMKARGTALIKRMVYIIPENPKN
jgi:hypothetical protein